MKRFLIVAGLLLACTLVHAQEVIVFENNRSMVVDSHREEGIWTYLKMNGGELAVRTDLIKQIREEGQAAVEAGRAASKPTTSPQKAGPDPSPTVPPGRRREQVVENGSWNQETDGEEEEEENEGEEREKTMKERREMMRGAPPQRVTPSEGSRRGRVPRGQGEPKKG